MASTLQSKFHIDGVHLFAAAAAAAAAVGAAAGVAAGAAADAVGWDHLYY